jgi:hypothetical protein
MKLLVHILIFIVSVASLFIAYFTGPMSHIDAVVSIDESYIQTLQKQYIYAGFVTAVASCIAAYLCKANLKVVAIILLVSGFVWVIFSQLGEPDFFNYFFGSIIDFMIPYSLVCLVVLVLLFGVNKKWPRLTKGN